MKATNNFKNIFKQNEKDIIFSSCKTEEEKSLTKYIINTIESDFTKKYPEEAGKIYCTILYQVLYHTKDLENKEISGYIDTLCIVSSKNYSLFNNLLHFIHLRFSNARTNGIGYISSIREILFEEVLNIEVKFLDLQCYLDEFPEELEQKIEEIIKPIKDDLCINYATTWIYSHIGFGEDYSYKANEHPRIEIYFSAKQTEKILLNLLKNNFKNHKIIINQDFQEIYRNY